ncbi:molecular chaperone TorD family protein [Thaumasiovibrio sp. DFM-14]|uniref:molecular chaperone TorD family protein n=1 Tax=Thaumasiovibrio sp. DFM-14 TaxID=3384792 RepID=UPI0039A04176
MRDMALLPRSLGTLFYYSPDDERVQALLPEWRLLMESYQWAESERAEVLISEMEAQLASLNKYTHSRLFEGQGEMVAPPWGSVYLNKDNIVMGDSTAAYYCFLDRMGIDFQIHNQPLDQFGLMLFVLAHLMEEGDTAGTVEHLSIHLLPWCQRYLALLGQNEESPFYATLAQLTSLFIAQIQSEMSLVVDPVPLFK